MFSKSFFDQVGSIWLIQMVVVIIPAIDAYFLSGISSENIAAYALTNSFYVLWVIVSKGLLQGLCFAVAPKYGLHQHQQIGLLLTQSLWIVLFVTLCSWGLLYLSSLSISFYEMSDELKQLSTQYLYGVALSLPAIFCLRVLSSWLQGIYSSQVLILWYWVGLIFKIFVAYVLISGYLGNQWKNISGIALSTTLFYWFVLIGLFFTIKSRFSSKYQFKIFAPIDIISIVNVLRYGVPLAIAYLIEFSIFPFINSILVIYHQDILVSHEILYRIYSLIFSLPIAFILTSSIQVGQNYQVDVYKTKNFVIMSEKIIIAIVFILGLTAYLTKSLWIDMYSKKVDITTMITMVFPVMVLRLFVESLQSLWAFNLRAIDRGWRVVLVSAGCLWGTTLFIWLLHSLKWLDLITIWLCLSLGYALGDLLLRRYFLFYLDSHNAK